jgi:RimJ/RimL family protein N-acetyltransferase/ribosomal protein S18 acetylase RimI-like enzyme
LSIRPFREDDIDGYLDRRSDPDVARYQDWELPYSRERAERVVKHQMDLAGPEDGEWWMAIVCDADSGEVFGDVGAELSWQGRTAEIGYTFAKEHWGRGYAAEAVEALVEYLFEVIGVTRVCGTLHPDNSASAMVLERNGLLFEGHTRSSFWVGEELSDDWIYGMTRQDWETWRRRPRRPPDEVQLVEITAENVADVLSLRTHRTQEEFVAPMLKSFADALIPEVVNGAPVVPWLRAVTADDDIVGFVMLALTTEHHPEPFLWRLLIDRLHQRRGIGERALALVSGECRRMGDRTLLTSWGEGRGSPRGFYLANGFEPTGDLVDGETEGRKQLG